MDALRLEPRTGADGRTVARLAQIGQRETRELFHLFTREQFSEGDEEIDLEDWQVGLCERALLRLGYERLSQFLREERLRKPSNEDRRGALRLLGQVGRRHDLALMMEWSGAGTGENVRGRTKRALETALADALRRDPRGFDILQSEWADLPDEIGASVIRGASAVQGNEGLAFLAHVLVWDEDHTGLAMTEYADLADRCKLHPDESVVSEIREFASSEEEDVCETAVLSLGRLSDLPSIPLLIELLEDDRGRIAQAAAWSLNEITGQAIRGKLHLWQAWYADELAWFEKEASNWYASLANSDSTKVLEAIRQLARRVLQRSERVYRFSQLIHDQDVGVARSACSGLARIGSADAVPVLYEALEDHRLVVQQAARQALIQIYGADVAEQMGVVSSNEQNH